MLSNGHCKCKFNTKNKILNSNKNKIQLFQDKKIIKKYKKNYHFNNNCQIH